MSVSTWRMHAYEMAHEMAHAYMGSAQTASDGTIFVPSPVAMAASANLAIVQINSDGSLAYVYDSTLYANPNVARDVVKSLCERYENEVIHKEENNDRKQNQSSSL